MILWLLACAGPVDTGLSGQDEVLQGLAEQFVPAYYQEFEVRSAALSSAATQLCAAPDASTLDAARNAWWAAREPWKQAEIVQFGPIEEYPDRLGPKLDDWPVNSAAVEALVAGEGALDAAAFEAMGSATRGLPVVEWLLWAQGDDTLDALSADPRRCAVLAGAAADVAANASRLVLAWEQDWMPRYAAPAPDDGDNIDSLRDMLDLWVNRMGFEVHDIRDVKLGKPLGEQGVPRLDALESRPSARSLTDARDALAGVQAAWSGEGHPGVRSLVQDSALQERLDTLFTTTAQRLAELPEPLEDTLTTQPELVQRAQDALAYLQSALQLELGPALGVSLTFSDNDGD